MNPRVLFAEDDLSIRESFTAILKLEGASVTACPNAEEACRCLSENTFDLVITDMRMETPTAGWQVVRTVQALPHPPKLAVMTAFPIPRAELRKYHVYNVLMKATPTLTLISKLRELLQQSVAHRTTHPPKRDGHHNQPLHGD